MPDLLQDLPQATASTKYDFSRWADGQAWKFVRGRDYDSSTETFRYNVRRWAKAHGYVAECRYLAALDEHNRALPVSKADPVALAVRFSRAAGDGAGAGAGSSRARRDAATPAAVG